MSARVQLTEQQQAVVAHNEGPALVFAVAGAGKTTAMVHRIERLVREGVFAPERILATSFGRSNAQDLRQSLNAWPHCAAVRASTLHALGRRIILRAQQVGYGQNLKLNDTHAAGFNILRLARAAARQENALYKQELESLDEQDFLNYVAACKGNLIYADLESRNLPASALHIATQAPPLEGAFSWYPDFYRVFETVRQQQGIITFDDMLLTGWEILVTLPQVRAEVQALFHCVLVDEFQDINRAQSELLDIISQPGRHYMAVGDDDQTIYEWRGADPIYILDFARRYRAQTYVISENFRCPAGPLVLANAVIRHNKQRQAKHLQLTRGFHGVTQLQSNQDAHGTATAIVRQIQAYQQQGFRGSDMAILVRLNAQTPPIEHALITADVNYAVAQPFYDRLEVKTLIDYVRLAWLEARLEQGQPLTTAQINSFQDAWNTLCNRPKRYISNHLRDQIRQLFARHQRPLHQLLQEQAQIPANESIAPYLENLGQDLHWLSRQLQQPAITALRGLEKLLSYEQFWRDSSGFVQTGAGRAAAVAAFIEFAGSYGSLLDFMMMLNDLRQRKVGQDGAHNPHPVILTTIHRAKGLEWPIVFLPDCNQGIIPFLNERDDNLEEERRLFYVGITRTRQHLHLYAIHSQMRSQFLTEAQSPELLRAIRQMQLALTADPAGWQAADALALARYTPQFQLESYFHHWWDAPAAVRTRIAHRVQEFLATTAAQNQHESWQLPPNAADLWQAIAPLPPGNPGQPFAGMAELIPPAASPTTAQSAGQSAAQSAGRDAGKKAPPFIVPGTWVQCDAGWGQVEKIIDAHGQMLDRLPTPASRARFIVQLRPGSAAERVEIDLTQKWVFFSQNLRIYTCSKCERFSTTDPYRIVSQHNNAAHGGVGASYRPEKQLYRPLKHLLFQTDAPPDPFA